MSTSVFVLRAFLISRENLNQSWKCFRPKQEVGLVVNLILNLRRAAGRHRSAQTNHLPTVRQEVVFWSCFLVNILVPSCFSLRELLETTCRLANALKAHRIQKGDRVAVYMLVSPLAVAAMLACARIGAVHTVAFAGFSSQALAGRIQDVGVRLPRWRRVWLHGGHRLNHRTQPPLSCWTAHLCTWIQVSRVSSTKTPCFTYTASSGGKIPHSPLEAF
ncbi:acetyl-coenzyme A synthetase isoform X2 [Poecilia reticulata]|uniref:acetyl-coenzyme A synthetase isoform X2 n=1 Tax=Poecilia reticulata TaxID=8081 RepID=UPI0007EAAB81|nr:PREDICTED: acetyl-coenzyme A synthetase 2-like, mitochondrial isoform X2 [Poecilia reticulata]XP_017164622.1 PREDICTED: acetyl-coenzyme A synthetase 2-like, mitochondrial isoform X2 [Poecilia reticulata]